MNNLSDTKIFRIFILMVGNALIWMLLISIFVKKGNEVIWINSFHHPILDSFFFGITGLGNGLIVIPFLFSWFFIRLRYALCAAISFSTIGLVCASVKDIFNVPRPVSVIDPSLLHFVDSVNIHTQHSFPSGHTATIFCLATLISLTSKNSILTIISLLVAFLVGLSRIYLAQHFLIDVAAGAFLGCVVAFICWTILGKISYRWLNGRIKFPNRLISIPRTNSTISPT
jgi:membrane-associated phospholipid phosphatase